MGSKRVRQRCAPTRFSDLSSNVQGRVKLQPFSLSGLGPTGRCRTRATGRVRFRGFYFTCGGQRPRDLRVPDTRLPIKRAVTVVNLGNTKGSALTHYVYKLRGGYNLLRISKGALS